MICFRNLKDADIFSKSDPMCVIFVQPFGEDRWVEYQRTEHIMNTLNPDFSTKVVMSYHFEEQQNLKFELYDIDSVSKNLGDHDFLGQFTCSLGQIVSNGCLRKKLTATTTGEIILFVEELSSSKTELKLQFMGKKLDKKDWFGKSDPFLVFKKSTESGEWVVAYRTEPIKNTLNPVWKPFKVPVRTLCNGDYDRSLKVECYDWNRNGSHEIIGEFFTTVNQLSQGAGPHNTYDLINKDYKVDNHTCTTRVSPICCMRQVRAQ